MSKLSPWAIASLCALLAAASVQAEPKLKLNEKNYYETNGLNVIVFADIYPDGHQTGVTVIQHGVRVAANGDLRLEPSPGQWSPMPTSGAQTVDKATQTIAQTLSYPDKSKDRTGFNPILYPDLNFSYTVRVTPMDGTSFKVSVDLEKPLPPEWEGKVGFNFELFPGEYFSKAWIMQSGDTAQTGIFTRQANGPMKDDNGQLIAAPLSVGNSLTVAPDVEARRMNIRSETGQIELIDGRGNFNNSWYIVREITKKGATKDAIVWVITPNADENWRYKPVVQVSQVGYLPHAAKQVVIEQDIKDQEASELTLYRLNANGREVVKRMTPKNWGHFLRYNYLMADMSDVSEAGQYVLDYRGQTTHSFRIGADVYDRGIWQPTLEYFLPVQMSHMRVEENYRVWHDLGHIDDARMAPINYNHFDGYLQGPSTLTKYQSGEHVPFLDHGGWHDAGDYDLRVESQMGTIYLLSKMVEEFGAFHDDTSIDQTKRLTRIHRPDGKNDFLQQIEHGLLSVLGGYKAMGRTYRGIIEPNLEQYTLLGDAAVQTDNVAYSGPIVEGKTANNADPIDDRYVFTEDNPNRELDTAAGLAAAARVMRGYNDTLASEAIVAAEDLFEKAFSRATSVKNKVFVLSELAQTTKNPKYIKMLVAMKPEIIANIADTGPVLASSMPLIADKAFNRDVAKAVKAHQEKLAYEATLTPYAVPYKPYIWGAGWGIQEFGVNQYFFRKAWPEATPDTLQMAALNFVLGVHPGENTWSFASGVGANSATTAYGFNRADWSYIPGGVISGTALIRPDLPELKVWPYFWQQGEYVLGGGETNYMFLVLAAQKTKP